MSRTTSASQDIRLTTTEALDLDVILKKKDAFAIYINRDLGTIRNTHTTQTMHVPSHTTSQFHGCFQEGLWSGHRATGAEQDNVDFPKFQSFHLLDDV